MSETQLEITDAAPLDAEAMKLAAFAVFAKTNELILTAEKNKALWPSQHHPHWDGLAEAAVRAYLSALPLLQAQIGTVKADLKFQGIAEVKLETLLLQGWEINGYAIQKDGRHGFVTTGAFVGWWLPEYHPNHVSGDNPPAITLTDEGSDADRKRIAELVSAHNVLAQLAGHEENQREHRLRREAEARAEAAEARAAALVTERDVALQAARDYGQTAAEAELSRRDRMASRRTLPIPDGHEAVRDADGRATGETRPVLKAEAEPYAWEYASSNGDGTWSVHIARSLQKPSAHEGFEPKPLYPASALTAVRLEGERAGVERMRKKVAAWHDAEAEKALVLKNSYGPGHRMAESTLSAHRESAAAIRNLPGAV